VSTGPATQPLRERLGRAVGPDHVLTDPALVEGYVRDWTGRWRGDCALVVRPGDEVAAMLAVKRALDPDGRLGGALLPFDGARRPV
jgi:FAD/FMN-containing dehydrogenase